MSGALTRGEKMEKKERKTPHGDTATGGVDTATAGGGVGRAARTKKVGARS